LEYNGSKQHLAFLSIIEFLGWKSIGGMGYEEIFFCAAGDFYNLDNLKLYGSKI